MNAGSRVSNYRTDGANEHDSKSVTGLKLVLTHGICRLISSQHHAVKCFCKSDKWIPKLLTVVLEWQMEARRLRQLGCPAQNRPLATMSCRRRRLLVCLFLVFCLIYRLLVISSIINAFKILPSTLPFFVSKGGRALSCLPPVWNLRAVIWFHHSICSLVILPSPVAHSVISLFLLLARSPSCLLSRNVFKLFFP